jgi:hypothetical protein
MTASKRQLIASASLGELAANYRLVKAEKEAKEIFDKMSDHCEFADKLSNDPNTKDCLYYGRPAKHVCVREICPILEKE